MLKNWEPEPIFMGMIVFGVFVILPLGLAVTMVISAMKGC